jgi:hypothetical protein
MAMVRRAAFSSRDVISAERVEGVFVDEVTTRSLTAGERLKSLNGDPGIQLAHRLRQLWPASASEVPTHCAFSSPLSDEIE